MEDQWQAPLHKFQVTELGFPLTDWHGSKAQPFGHELG